MQEYSFKLAIGYDTEFNGPDAIKKIINTAGDTICEGIKELPGVSWAGGDAFDGIYELTVFGGNRTDIEAYLEYKADPNGGEGDFLGFDLDGDKPYKNLGRPIDKKFNKGGGVAKKTTKKKTANKVVEVNKSATAVYTLKRDGDGPDIKYWVGKNKSGKWTVFSESEKWKNRDEFEFGLPSEKDATDMAKLMASVVKESDPEEAFMRNEYSGGGKDESKEKKAFLIHRNKKYTLYKSGTEKEVYDYVKEYGIPLNAIAQYWNDGKEYRLYLYFKPQPPAESTKYPGQFTIGPDDGEKAMYTQEELVLLNSGWIIELEFNASRRGKAEMEAYQKEFNYETKLTNTDDEFGGKWRLWKKVGSPKNSYSEGGSFNSIEDLINGDINKSVEFIYSILKSDYYYTEELGSLKLVAEQTLQVISMFAKHDENNPIITKYNDKVFFKPGPDVLEDNGLFIGTIKYAAHFVTAKTRDEKHRTFDESKANNLGLLYDCIHNPERRIEEEIDGLNKIYYTKNYILDNKERRFVSLFFVEIDMDGHIRCITIMPNKNKNWKETKKEGGLLIAPPQSFLLSPNSSIKDAQVREISSKAIEHANTKESDTNIQQYFEFRKKRDKNEVIIVCDEEIYDRSLAFGGGPVIPKESVEGAIKFIKDAGNGYSVHSNVFGGWDIKQYGNPVGGKYSDAQIIEFAENIGYNKKGSFLDMFRDNWMPKKYPQVVHYEGGGRLDLLKKMYAKKPTTSLKERIDELEKKQYKINYFDNKKQRVIDKEFVNYEQAAEWGKKNLENFNSDLIQKMNLGGTVTKSTEECIDLAMLLPKYQDLLLEEATWLYGKFGDKTKLYKTTEDEYYVNVEVAKDGTRTNDGRIVESLENKGYGYEIADDFTAYDKTFEFIHAVRMYQNNLPSFAGGGDFLLSTDLYLKEGVHDKEYHIQIVKRDSNFGVVAQYGRRGAHLQEDDKGTFASYGPAEKEFYKVKNSKLHKGYVEVESSGDPKPKKQPKPKKTIPFEVGDKFKAAEEIYFIEHVSDDQVVYGNEKGEREYIPLETAIQYISDGSWKLEKEKPKKNLPFKAGDWFKTSEGIRYKIINITPDSHPGTGGYVEYENENEDGVIDQVSVKLASEWFESGSWTLEKEKPKSAEKPKQADPVEEDKNLTKVESLLKFYQNN